MESHGSEAFKLPAYRIIFGALCCLCMPVAGVERYKIRHMLHLHYFLRVCNDIGHCRLDKRTSSSFSPTHPSKVFMALDQIWS